MLKYVINILKEIKTRILKQTLQTDFPPGGESYRSNFKNVRNNVWNNKELYAANVMT